MNQLPINLLQAMYDNLPLGIRIDIQNYLFALDMLQTETDEEARAYIINELERIEQKHGITIDRKKAAQ